MKLLSWFLLFIHFKIIRSWFNFDFVFCILQCKANQLVAGAIRFLRQIVVKINNGFVNPNCEHNRLSALCYLEFVHNYHPDSIMMHRTIERNVIIMFTIKHKVI